MHVKTSQRSPPKEPRLKPSKCVVASTLPWMTRGQRLRSGGDAAGATDKSLPLPTTLLLWARFLSTLISCSAAHPRGRFALAGASVDVSALLGRKRGLHRSQSGLLFG